MVPSSEVTKLEGKDHHHEYLAAGKLKGNKALITGGEYDYSFCNSACQFV